MRASPWPGRAINFGDADGVVLELVQEVFRRDEDRRAGVAAYWAAREQA